MANKHLTHIDGLADIPGSAHVSIATGGRQIYVSGQVGNLADGTVVEGFWAQTAQAFRNLVVALAAAGASPADLVKVTFLIVDWTEDKLGDLIEAAIEVFGAEFPTNTSTLHGVATLFDPRCLIEIDAIAVAG